MKKVQIQKCGTKSRILVVNGKQVGGFFNLGNPSHYDLRIQVGTQVVGFVAPKVGTKFRPYILKYRVV
jgi:hypothetical protein